MTSPFANSIALVLPSRNAWTSKNEESALTALIPTPFNPTDFLNASESYFAPVLIRAAQGSATVAMITSVGMFGGLAAGGQLGFHPVYLALAIGCGSKPLPWMNDSGFWVIGRMSGMNERETLKTLTAQLSVMGVVGLVIVMVLAAIFPMTPLN